MAKYKSRMKEQLQKQYQSRMNESRGSSTLAIPEGTEIDFFKVKKTKYVLDIIPYVTTAEKHPDGCGKGELWPSRRYFVHRNVGSEDRSYICPSKTFGKPCPICEYAAKRQKQGADKDELSALRPRERDLFHVIDVEEDPKKVLLWDVSSFLFTKALLSQLADEDDPVVYQYAELEGGYSLKIRFKKEKLGGREFYEAERIDFVERKKDYKESILEQTLQLDDILVCPTYKQLESAFYMESEDEQKGKEQEEEEEAPKPRTKKREVEQDEEEEAPKPRRRHVQKDENEEEEEPKSKPSPKKAREEEEEEAPKPKSSGKCPHGYKWGKDCDAYDECEDCDSWAKCHKASDD